MNNGYGKKNFSSFNNNAHLATNIRDKVNNVGYNNYTSFIPEEIDNSPINELTDELNNDLIEKPAEIAKKGLEKNNNNKSSLKNKINEKLNSKDKKKGFNLADTLFKKKGFGKGILNLKMKLIIIGFGGIIFLFFIALLVLCTSGNGSDLDIVNDYKDQYRSNDNGDSSSNIDVGDVTIGSDGLVPLTVSIVDAIGMNNYNTLNDKVMAASKSNGCSKVSMAKVASTLAEELSHYGYRVPYYWGGGHSGIFYMGVDKTLGAVTNVSCSDTNCYNHVGYDCSGFISWAATLVIGRNVSMITNGFMNVSTPISFEEAGAGDIIVSESHIILILQNNGSTFLTVESQGGNIGVIFGTYDQVRINSLGMQIKSMSNYFANNC